MWGATGYAENVPLEIIISIHAPMWGATAGLGKLISSSISISIHAPMWGATFGAIGNKPLVSNFNPRTHVGCDFVQLNLQCLVTFISIHAPMWGATVPFDTVL